MAKVENTSDEYFLAHTSLSFMDGTLLIFIVSSCLSIINYSINTGGGISLELQKRALNTLKQTLWRSPFMEKRLHSNFLFIGNIVNSNLIMTCKQFNFAW